MFPTQERVLLMIWLKIPEPNLKVFLPLSDCIINNNKKTQLAPSSSKAQWSRTWWEAVVAAQTRSLYGARELFSLPSEPVMVPSNKCYKVVWDKDHLSKLTYLHICCSDVGIASPAERWQARQWLGQGSGVWTSGSSLRFLSRSISHLWKHDKSDSLLRPVGHCQIFIASGNIT